MTLVDSLDTLLVFNDTKKFEESVKTVIKHVSFDKSVTVSLFECTIRSLQYHSLLRISEFWEAFCRLMC